MTGSARTFRVRAGRCILSAGGSIPKEIYIVFLIERESEGGEIVPGWTPPESGR